MPILLSACQHGPEWGRRAGILLRDPRFPRPPAPDTAPRCLSDDILAAGLRAAVSSVGFDDVIDFGPLYGAGCGPRAKPGCDTGRGRVGHDHFPQIDLSVIAFNRPGCAHPVVKATVVFDRRHPDGFVAQHDPATLQIGNIRFQKWDEARWNGGRWVLAPARDAADGPVEPPATARISAGTDVLWDAPYPAAQALGPNRVAADKSDAVDFMSPWPASVFKLMVATYYLHLLDRGHTADGATIDLDTPIPLPEASLVPACPADPQPRTLTLLQALQTMLQWSGNCATAALVRYLHTHDEIQQSPEVDAAGFALADPLRNPLNDLFAGLGLPTLQMNRTLARSGRWGNGADNYDLRTASVANNHMTSWDSARLLWLVDDLPSPFRAAWDVAPGQPVAHDFVSSAQKAFLRQLLADAYSGSALASNRTCPEGRTHPTAGPPPVPGILARLSDRWLDGSRLHSPVGDYPYPRVVDDVHPASDVSPYSADLSPCQARAEVVYLNKAGLTNVAHSSVGIVRGLGAPQTGDRTRDFHRHYIVSFFSTLGTRYTDAQRVPILSEPAPASPTPRSPPIATTQTVPKLGATLDAWLALWLE